MSKTKKVAVELDARVDSCPLRRPTRSELNRENLLAPLKHR